MAKRTRITYDGFRDRIRELRRVPAGELQADPRNWRRHPENQKRALRGVLAEIGYADALIAREDQEGGLILIDGHLRAETTPDQMVPVLVTDLTEQEAAKYVGPTRSEDAARFGI